jgi:hypothetical protein
MQEATRVWGKEGPAAFEGGAERGHGGISHARGGRCGAVIWC